MQVVLVLALNLAETGIKKTAACKSSLVCSCIRCAQTHKSLILILTLRDSRSFNVVEKRLVSPAASRVGPLMHAPIKQRSIHMLWKLKQNQMLRNIDLHFRPNSSWVLCLSVLGRHSFKTCSLLLHGLKCIFNVSLSLLSFSSGESCSCIFPDHIRLHHFGNFYVVIFSYFLD